MLRMMKEDLELIRFEKWLQQKRGRRGPQRMMLTTEGDGKTKDNKMFMYQDNWIGPTSTVQAGFVLEDHADTLSSAKQHCLRSGSVNMSLPASLVPLVTRLEQCSQDHFSGQFSIQPSLKGCSHQFDSGLQLLSLDLSGQDSLS